mmetsp:Transcript_6747/g.24319  ORF Transcript_6747/g.24319 Transcript_6747/m.24319 type:complete len:121 (-) Transcript_6747:77-439(-)
MKDPRDDGRGSLLVRRIGALPGEAVVSASDDSVSLELDSHEVWVMADNEDSGEALPADSRTFGPVDARHHVFGRVVYSIRSAADHSPVRNPSRRSRAMDGAMALALDDHEIIQKFQDAYK